MCRAARRSLIPLLASLPLTLGCEPQTFPPGTGARGKPLEVLRAPDDSLEEINKLETPEQQAAFDWLHQPFREVARFDGPPAQRERFEQLADVADEIPYVTIADDVIHKYGIRLVTSHGSYVGLTVPFVLPSLTRGILATFRAGYFEGKRISAGEGVLWIGDPIDEPLFTMNARALGTAKDGILVLPTTEEGRAHGSRFGITLEPAPPGSKGMVVLSKLKPIDDSPELEELARLASEEEVVIDRVEIIRSEARFFGKNGPRLPGPSELEDPQEPLDLPEEDVDVDSVETADDPQ